MPNYFAHESSYIDDGSVIGDGTKIWHFCHVMPGAIIGERCNLGQNVVVMSGTRMGANCRIQNNVSIYEGVVLEDDGCGGFFRQHEPAGFEAGETNCTLALSDGRADGR